jgi:alcohol dehydrogenase
VRIKTEEVVMKALSYQGPGRHSWEEVPEPTVQDDRDVIVRVDAVTICGTDLHILKGDVPTCEPGTILGHEAVGTITAVGSGVRDRRPGDRVLVSCISSCGTCESCRAGSYGQCTGGGGWILGHRVHGVQAELARVPFADTSTYLLPESISDEDAVLLADILPTSFEVGVLNGRVAPGDSVVIIGAGPIGLAAILTSALYSPADVVVVDPSGVRRDAAKRLGATVTVSTAEEARTALAELGHPAGADVCIEAVGLPATFEACCSLVRPGGHVANVGVHGAPVTLHLEELWIRNVTITTGLVDTRTTARLLRMLERHQLAVHGLITHRYGLDEMMDAYDVFSRAEANEALKVALFRHG